MKILVTGGTGFIGRELVKLLAREYGSQNLVCLVYSRCDNDLERSGRRVLGELGAATVPVDLLTREGFEQVPRSPDVVFHLASVTITAEPDHRINTVGTRNLLEALLPLSPAKHFVFASTICVNDNRADFGHPVTERSPQCRPCNEYGRKKLEAEQYLREMARENGFPLSIVRVCGVYGDGVRTNGLYDVVHKGSLRGSLVCRLDWPGKIAAIHVDDMARFLCEVSRRRPAAGESEVYIPSMEVLTMAQMCRTVCEAYGLPYRPLRVPRLVWSMIRMLARNKRLFESCMPHRLYDRFWQGCILVNNEFWNVSEKVPEVVAGWKPTLFAEYYARRRAREQGFTGP